MLSSKICFISNIKFKRSFCSNLVNKLPASFLVRPSTKGSCPVCARIRNFVSGFQCVKVSPSYRCSILEGPKERDISASTNSHIEYRVTRIPSDLNWKTRMDFVKTRVKLPCDRGTSSCSLPAWNGIPPIGHRHHHPAISAGKRAFSYTSE